MTYEDALAILRDGWPITPEDLAQIAAHAWDEGAEAQSDYDWLAERGRNVDEPDNPYRNERA